MKLGITGSRLFYDYAKIKADILEKFPNPFEIKLILSGGAKGVDSLCEKFAREFGITIKQLKPDYNTHGKGAPLVRNREIVNECDLLMAWPMKDVSRGTYYTINYAEENGKPVIINELLNEK